MPSVTTEPRPGAGATFAVQRRGADSETSTPQVQQVAADGVKGGGGALPHLAAIQHSFGRHDVSGIAAHVGGAGGAAASSMGAEAYATGDSVAFRGAPSLHTAAHEAAHVIQQRRGVSLKGGVGKSGDVYERHADAVADAVVQGKSAQSLLDTMAPSGGGRTANSYAVQRALQLDTGTMTETASVGEVSLRVGDVIEYTTTRFGLKVTSINGKPLTPPAELTIGKMEFLKKVESGGTSPSEGGTTPPRSEPQRGKLRSMTPSSVSVEEERPSGPKKAPNGLKVGDRVRLQTATPEGGWEITALNGAGERSTFDLTDPHGKLGSKRMVLYSRCVTWTPEIEREDENDTSDGENKLVRDQDASSDMDQIIRKTPAGLKGSVKSLEGKTPATTTMRKQDWSETANILVNYVLDESEGLKLEFDVMCNPKYMCKTKGEVKDLVPVYLEYANDRYADLMCVVEPSKAQNAAKVTMAYSWKCLGTMLRLPDVETLDNTEIWKRLGIMYPTLGVKAQWLAALSSGSNSANHTMGGVLQKGGSGLIKLRKLTLEDYEATEDDRNTEWNEGEMLSEERPVFQRFPNLLKLGKEMATTLEAESEYMVEDETTLRLIVEQMKGLLGSKSKQASCGILSMEGSTAPKQYVDTYYDIVGSKDGKNDKALLKNQVVMRRRHVSTDKPGTFLFCIKGRSVQMDETEVVRLAAQMQLQQEHMSELKDFLKDKNPDNPFARVFQDALDKKGVDLDEGETEGESGWDIAPVMMVESERYKFLMKLEDSTAIDFSADIATGYVGEKTEDSPKVCSFEFGVGHPGLTATSTGGSRKTGSGSEGGKGTGKIHRPYHVPKDVENTSLIEKSDYKQYQELRGVVMDKILKAKGLKLAKGGNKASLLAGLLGLI